MEITATNPNQALAETLHWLKVAGLREPSRNGTVIAAPEPLLITLTRPQERVLFSPLRDANPFFHLIGDGLWCLNGRDNLDWPVYFNKNFAQYSDDGLKHPGAYGYRWRHYFGVDQIELVLEELRLNPESRRAVITHWDGGAPERLGDSLRVSRGTKDAPCNVGVFADLRGGRLNLTVLNRSNDIWYGLFGANTVQFSLLQEYLAAHLYAPVGLLRHFTNNAHFYTSVVAEERLHEYATDLEAHDYYLQGKVAPLPLIQNLVQWDKELFRFMETPWTVNWLYTEPFFREVAAPMYAAWKERKEAGLNGLIWVEKIVADDWRLACTEWIERRAAKKAQSAN